jgi:hypothetical protein
MIGERLGMLLFYRNLAGRRRHRLFPKKEQYHSAASLAVIRPCVNSVDNMANVEKRQKGRLLSLAR